MGSSSPRWTEGRPVCWRRRRRPRASSWLLRLYTRQCVGAEPHGKTVEQAAWFSKPGDWRWGGEEAEASTVSVRGGQSRGAAGIVTWRVRPLRQARQICCSAGLGERTCTLWAVDALFLPWCAFSLDGRALLWPACGGSCVIWPACGGSCVIERQHLSAGKRRKCCVPWRPNEESKPCDRHQHWDVQHVSSFD